MRGADLTYALGQYLNFSYSRDSRVDQERGYEDGLRGYPRASQKGLSPYEYQLIHQARADIDSYKSAVDDELDSLDQEIVSLRQKRNESYDGRRKDLAIRHKQDLEELRQSMGPGAPSTMDVQAKLTDASDRYNALARREGREVQLHFDRPFVAHGFLRYITVYAAMLAFLAVVELPININPFLTLLGTDNLISAAVVALLVGALFVILAHALGVVLRTAGVRRRAVSVVSVLLILTLAGLLAYGMSVLRQSDFGVVAQAENMAGTASTAAGLSDPLTEALTAGARTAARVARPVIEPQDFFQPLTKEGWVLLLINLGVFTVGTLLSFFRHDPNPHFEHAYLQREALGAKLDDRLAKYENYRAQLDSHYALLREDLAVVGDRLANEIEQRKVQYDATRTRSENDVAQVIDVIKQRIQAYQQGNLEGRDRESPPEYFGGPAMQMVEEEILRRPGTGHRDTPGADEATVQPLRPV